MWGGIQNGCGFCGLCFRDRLEEGPATHITNEARDQRSWGKHDKVLTPTRKLSTALKDTQAGQLKVDVLFGTWDIQTINVLAKKRTGVKLCGFRVMGCRSTVKRL